MIDGMCVRRVVEKIWMGGGLREGGNGRERRGAFIIYRSRRCTTGSAKAGAGAGAGRLAGKVTTYLR